MRSVQRARLSSSDLYYAVYDAARRRVASMPRASLGRGTLVLRRLERGLRSWDSPAARSVPSGARTDSSRWSGAQPGGAREPGAAGLYVNLESEWSLRRALEYRRPQPMLRYVSRGNTVVAVSVAPPAPGPAWEFAVFALERTLTTVDLTDGPRWAFLMELSREVDVRDVLDRLGFPDLVAAMQARRDDDSIPRALGNAALGRSGASALIVPAEDDDYASLLGATGMPRRNAVLAGAEGVPLACLKPVRSLVCEELDGRRLACVAPPD